MAIQASKLIIPMTMANKSCATITYVAAMYLILFLFVCTGCASLKQSDEYNTQDISELQAFDGIYNNVASGKEDLQFCSLWSQLMLQNKVETTDFMEAKIELKAVGKNQIRVRWLKDSTESKSIILKGKFRDNHFISKHKRTILPIPLIYGRIENNQFQLWLDQDKQLHLDRLQNRWGWVFLFLAGKDETTSYQYKREIYRSENCMEVQSFDTIVTKLTYQDKYGNNTLHIKVTNPCDEASTKFDGPLTQMDALLKNEKGSISSSYRYPYPQMSLIKFVKEEIHLQDLSGRSAAIIPFYYCGGYESYDMKVSYMVFFENKHYVFHLDFYCGEGKDCKPVKSLKSTLKVLPKDLRDYLVGYLTKKHKLRASFHQE